MLEACIFAGNYGSGKTELSLNTALEYAKKGKTVLCDLDIVNPYFRSAEHAKMLEDAGIRLIAPPFANTTVDVPALSAEVLAAFEYDYAVFDAGGDPVGAAALGTYNDAFKNIRDFLQFYYVINARRPLQQTALQAAEMLMQIEDKSRLKIDGLVNNTNLGRDTSAADLEFGEGVCEEISEITGIPLAYASGTEETIKKYKESGFKGDTRVLKVFTRPDWLDETADGK